MKAQTSGKIVNLSSIAGRGLSVSSSSAYAAAKGGLTFISRVWQSVSSPCGLSGLVGKADS
jgi:NAD(P)-dependent dehydrogenase (short-subunit alcohol dehydrogenase family)